MIKYQKFKPSQLDRFLDLQRTSFAILETMAASLQGGESEKDVAHELVKRYRAAGADAFFHLPVVLFGERTALPGNWRLGHFFPKARRLRSGDSVILDAAPLFDGYLVDTSYSFCHGDACQEQCSEHRAMMQHLAQYRRSVPEALNRGESFKTIAAAVQQSMQQAGYEAVHHKHPGEVLGHRAIKRPKLPIPVRMQGFDAVSLSWFKAMDALAVAGIRQRSPLWNQQAASDHGAHDGLWLVEPHAGRGDVGAKWEEILVIEQGRARWLDECPPHVRQWRKIEQGLPYAPSTEV